MKKLQILGLMIFVIALIAYSEISAVADSALYNKGISALKSGDSQTAINLISKALEFDPGNYRYYNDRGVAYKKIGDIEKALVDYSRALDIRPDYTNALNNRGVVFLQTGKYDKAIQDFTEALRYGGLESIVHTNLGVAHARAGDHQKAIKEFEAAIAQHPTDPRAFLFLAESFEQTGDSERSLKLYQRARTASTDPSVTAGIEKRIAALEKTHSSPLSPLGQSQATPSPALEEKKGMASQPPQSRGIQLARSLPSPSPNTSISRGTAPRGSSAQRPDEPKIESLKELERKSRVKAVEKFSPASREIYLQGIQFVEQGDSTKAIIRFEDCSQLEKRNKNHYGVAWNSFELGRVHSKLSDHLKASGYLEDAMKYFSSLKATDEMILTLVELANNRRAAGQKEKALQFYARAVEEANSKGYVNLASALQDIALGRTPKSAEQRSAEKPKMDNQPKIVQQPKADPQQKIASAAPMITAPSNERQKISDNQKQSTLKDKPKILSQDFVQKTESPENNSVESRQTQQRTRGQDYAKIETVGSRPFTSGQSSQSMSDSASGESKISSGNAHRGESETMQKGINHNKPGLTQSDGKAFKKAQNRFDDKSRLTAIRQDLLELRRLKQAGDESNMIGVLERISENYILLKDYERALHGLSASVAFREKIGKKAGIDITLYQSAITKEKMGDLSGALEDFTRCMTSAPLDSKTAVLACTSARAVISKMSVDPAIMDVLQRFWRSRAARDNQTETQTLYSIAKIYEKAERHQDALNYYDRASASVLTDKVKIYNKIGKSDLAEQAYAQAMEAFKKLDYSRYVNMKSNSSKPDSLSRQ